jgi:hypothetical protein
MACPKSILFLFVLSEPGRWTNVAMEFRLNVCCSYSSYGHLAAVALASTE